MSRRTSHEICGIFEHVPPVLQNKIVSPQKHPRIIQVAHTTESWHTRVSDE